MDVADLLVELKGCDQQFPVYAQTVRGVEAVTDIEPVLVDTDSGQQFAYLLRVDGIEPVDTSEMDTWLKAKGHG